MQISEKLYKAFQVQVTRELTNAEAYWQLSFVADAQVWPGLSYFFKKSAQEEIGHATKLADFLTDRTRTAKIGTHTTLSAEGEQTFATLVGTALKLEQQNTTALIELYSLCVTERDFEAGVYLNWFLAEQRVSERELFDILTQAQRAGSNAALLIIDGTLVENNSTP